MGEHPAQQRDARIRASDWLDASEDRVRQFAARLDLIRAPSSVFRGKRRYVHNNKRIQGKRPCETRVRCLSAWAIKAGLASGLVLGAAPAGAPQARAQNFTLGYSTGFLQDPFQVIQADSVIASGKKAGLKTLPVANANGDPGKQITDFHNLIAEGAQGILFVARDSEAIVPALDFAASKNVPAVSIDMGPAGGKAAMVVRADNIRMGEDACKLTGKALGGKGIVLSLMGDQATLNGRDRTSGFSDLHEKGISRHQTDRAADLLGDRQGDLDRADGGDLDAHSRRDLHAERRGDARRRAECAEERRQAQTGR